MYSYPFVLTASNNIGVAVGGAVGGIMILIVAVVVIIVIVLLVYYRGMLIYVCVPV